MDPGKRLSSHILAGGLLIVAGAALLLDNIGMLDIGPLWRFWPLILVGIGIVKIVNAASRREQGSGIWLLLLGLWFGVLTLNIGGLTFSDIWPALFIALGVSMIWKSFPAARTLTSEQESPHGA